jgi:hypothetical protein
MKIYTRNYRVFAVLIWMVLMLPAHSEPGLNEGVDPVVAWRPSSEDIVVPQDPSRSAFSEEENRILFMMLTAITPPGKSFTSDRGRPVDLSADDRRLIGDRLKETIGPRLLPDLFLKRGAVSWTVGRMSTPFAENRRARSAARCPKS